MSDNLNNTSFLFDSLMEHMTDNIYFKDAQSRFIMVNRAFCEWHGSTLEQVKGKTDFDLFSHAHAQQAFDDEQRIVATGEPLIGIEEKETWEDGRITWVSSTKMPLKNNKGEIIGTFGISRDITEHKEAELRASRYADEIHRIKEDMEEDVRMAGELQKTFFPSFYPSFPENATLEQSAVEFLHRYQSSGMVSGDFCTIRRLSETRSGIFLCDVMGHGVRAALGTALICAIVEEISGIAQDPGDFLMRMNELLLPILQQEDTFLYATACYMDFDVATGVLRVANAGHPDPLLFHEKGTSEWVIGDDSKRGPALAICPNASYPLVKRTLVPGDSVVMYTDGIYEIVNIDDEEFGEERLREASGRSCGKSLPDLFQSLISEAENFAGGDKFNDDVCLVGLRYRKPLS